MSINSKLFHLGNDVIALRKKIDEYLPHGSINKNIHNDIFNEMLRIINVIRMEAYQNSSEEQMLHRIELYCTQTDYLCIKEYMDALNVRYV